jgi:hypothetical protein
MLHIHGVHLHVSRVCLYYIYIYAIILSRVLATIDGVWNG